MKKIFLFASVSLLIILSLSSCNLYFGKKLLPIKYGLSKNEVKKIDDDVTKKTYSIVNTNPNLEFFVSYFNTMKASYFIYGFKDGKLIYWGFPYQFTRNEDKDIQAIGENAIEIIKKEFE